MGLFLVILSGLLYVAGDLVVIHWLKHPDLKVFLSSLIIYTLAVSTSIYACIYKNIAVVSVSVIMFNVGVLLLFSYWFLEVKLSPAQWVGIGLGILSICMLEL